MIISASYRTDIPAYYGDWFMNRLRAGYAEARNPYNGKPYRIDLTPAAVDAFVFWTRNPAPFSAAFKAVARSGKPFMAQMTITGYPRGLEPGVIDVAAAVASFRWLVAEFGPRVAVWRYDAVLLTAATPPRLHRDAVARLADALAGAADECVFSFAHIYAKSRRGLDRTGLSWRDPSEAAKRQLLAELATIVRERGIRPTLCAQPGLVSPPLAPARCIDGARLADLGAPTGALKPKGARPGCLCAPSRDIGRYDACPQGCAYCYATSSRAVAAKTLRAHDPAATGL